MYGLPNRRGPGSSLGNLNLLFKMVKWEGGGEIRVKQQLSESQAFSDYTEMLGSNLILLQLLEISDITPASKNCGKCVLLFKAESPGLDPSSLSTSENSKKGYSLTTQ